MNNLILSLAGAWRRRRSGAVRGGLLALLALAPMLAVAQPNVVSGPAGSVQFGNTVTVLPNGNYVVTDPRFSQGGMADVGAVYLYDGRTNALISTLTGSQAGNSVGGGGGVTVLANGNYVVWSPYWDNGAATQAGAVTWCSSTTGRSGVVSAANSLVGSQANDFVGGGSNQGRDGVVALPNGNYVVISSAWANVSATNAGAATWGNGSTGTSGVVSAANSLVGSQADDNVGGNGVTALPNNNYVVSSPSWANGSATRAGAATWGNGSTGTSGTVSASNSLIGSQAYDAVSSGNGAYGGVVDLANGNYVVNSPNWANGTAANAGAVTWANGSTSSSGTVSTINSLTGSQAYDYVGSGFITVLTNGHYVVSSPSWANGTVGGAGAATWGNGSTGTNGAVSASNSLVGSQANDGVGGITALTNGHYVVTSSNWDNGAVSNVGAVTWGNGSSGIRGAVSASNSLIGSQADDHVGNSRVTALANGHYVVSSSQWDNGAITDVGAATWVNGSAATSGVVTAGNSLTGSQAYDGVSGGGITALTNNSYVVSSPYWSNGAISAVGAATWASGSAATSGVVGMGNSLTGSQENDYVSVNGITALANGNYVVGSRTWDNGATSDAGAATWGNGSTGSSGAVSASNSLVGSKADDQIGLGITALANGNYVLNNFSWDNGSLTNAGAYTLGKGSGGTTGPVTGCNSVVGSVANAYLSFGYRPADNTLLVGLPSENKVQLGTGTAAPTGAASQSFGNGSTVANLVATGTAIKWYATSTSSTALASTTALVNGSTYYATQAVGGCESTSRLAVTVSLTATPSLTSISPGSGATGTSVTLTGINLSGATSVSFNGTAQTTITNNTGTNLTATVPNGATTGLVTVATPSGISNGFVFTVTGPVITAFAPTFTRSGQTVTITGQNLTGTTSLTFSGVSQPTFSVNAGGTQLTAVVPSTTNPLYPNLTSGNIQVTTSVGTTTSATPLRLLAISGATTAVDGNPFGLMAQAVNITGSGFGGGTLQFALAYPAVVRFPVAYTVVDETHITTVVPDVSGTTARDGHGSWLVTNTPGTVDANYELLSPVVTSISPANAPAGTQVLVTGFNFTHNDIRPGYPHYNQLSTITGFDFNIAHGTNFQLLGPTGYYAEQQAHITVPTGLSGSVYVQATGGYLQGGGQIQGYYFGAAAPALSSISPTSGAVGSTITINGTDLSGTTTITFAGSSGNTVTTGFTVNAAGTQLTGVVVPSGATTGSLTVTNATGTSNGLTFAITVPPLLLTSTSPANAARAASATGGISATFNQPLAAGSTAALKVFSAQRGGLRNGHSGSTTVSGSTVSFAPTYALRPGETVQATITTAATATAGGSLATGKVWQFTAAAGVASGTFAGGSDPAVGSSPIIVRAADVDNDGDLDLLTSDVSSSAVSIRLNNGSGSFGGSTSVNVVYSPWGMTTGDVNGDGNVDFVAAGGTGAVAIGLNNGSGAFTISYYSLGASLRGLALADIDGDGDLDILASDVSNAQGLTLVNTGSGFTAGSSVGVGNDPEGLAAADVDGDGDVDLLTANYTDNSVSVRLNNGSGSFSGGSTVAVGNNPNGLTLADVDGDNDLDLLTADSYGNSVSVRLNDGSGSFGGGSAVSVAALPVRVTTADVDGDGDLDLLVASVNTNAVSVRLNNGSGTFAGSQDVAVGATPRDVVAADVDGDGDVDLLTANYNSSGTVSVRFNQAPTYPDLTISTGSLGSPVDVATGTYNSITVTATGVANLTGNTVVNSAVNVSGTLLTNCQPLTGAASFTLAAGSTLGICDAAGISSTASTGAVQTTGTHSFSPDASYVYDGTAAQNTGNALPAQVRNLTTTNAQPVTLTQAVRVAQVLTVGGAGNLVLNGQALTLLSDNSGTALTVNSSTGVVTGGTATVQRYLSTTNLGLGYRHYSAPVSGSAVNDLAVGTFTPHVNASYNTAAQPGLVTPFPTVFGYDQMRLTTTANNLGAFDKGWYSPAALTDALTVGQGYTVNLAGTEKIDFTGTLNTGTFNVPLARNTGSTTADAGWALVGNPYPAPLDWSLVMPADRPGLDAAIYVFESSSAYAGSYRSYVNGMGGGSPLLGSSQGFWVRVSAGQTTGSLTFRNSQRLTDYAQQVAVRRGVADSRPQVQLALQGAGNQTDNLFVYAQAGATPGLDAQYDAAKLPNPSGLNLAALAGTTPLAVQGLPELTTTTIVPLSLGVPAAGTYTLTAPALLNLPATTQVFLTDVLTGQRLDLRTLSAVGYSFTLSSVQAASAITGRFFLNLIPAAAPLASASQILAAGLQVYPNPAHITATVILLALPGATTGTLTLSDALGRTVRAQRLTLLTAGSTTLDLHGLATGVYMLRVQVGETQAIRRLTIN